MRIRVCTDFCHAWAAAETAGSARAEAARAEARAEVARAEVARAEVARAEAAGRNGRCVAATSGGGVIHCWAAQAFHNLTKLYCHWDAVCAG